MFGTNPIRKPVKGDGQILQVQSIFPTLQGEGPFTGVPAVFIRLGGCNLACDFCDTEFESFTEISLTDIMQQVQQLAYASNNMRGQQTAPALSAASCDLQEQITGAKIRHLIVITGGEPLRQNIIPLCEKLLADGFTVQIETNGTLWQPLPMDVDIVCSPKPTAKGYHPIREDLLERVSAFKFIISKSHPHYDKVPDIGQGIYANPVYVQPMDEQDEKKNHANTAHALALCQQHGYHLSLQTHKILGID